MNTLIIPDPHTPYMLPGTIPFAKYLTKKYDLKRTMCTGDILDNSATTRHELNPDGVSAGDELVLARKQMKKLEKAFPDMHVCIGNHDDRVGKMAFSSGISDEWIKSYNDATQTGFKFAKSFIFDDVKFIHGQGNLDDKVRETGMSHVGGHKHTKTSVHWHMVNGKLLWSMQLGTCADTSQKPFKYAEDFSKSKVTFGMIIDGLPVIVPMPEKYIKIK